MAILVRQVALRNFKSIASCKVDLNDITLLVGPNGVGKSNFLDALRLVSDALNATLEYAIRQRGGINEVRRRSGGHPTHFAIGMRLDLGTGRNAHYALQVGAKPEGAFNVQREQATLSTEGIDHAHFIVAEGELVGSSDELKVTQPKTSSDRLFLTSVSGVHPFRELFDALSEMRFYSINPEQIKEPQPHDSGERLDRSGWNLAAVIKRLGEERPERLARIEDYLRQIVPGIDAIEHKSYGPRETLEFRQTIQSQRHPWRFHAANMSDGTLRSLGVLTAIFHAANRASHRAAFVAVEEPEITIHPGAANVVMDALLEAARTEQVLATTHSPDLLDHPGITSESILAVESVQGETRISPVDAASRSAIGERLYTPGDLLRAGQLTPANGRQPTRVTQSDLFGAL